jgi:hypothetical protein
MLYNPLPPIPGFPGVLEVSQCAPSFSHLLKDLEENRGKENRVDLTKGNGKQISIYHAEPFNSNDQIDYTPNYTMMLKGYLDFSKSHPLAINVSEIQQIDRFIKYI